MSYGRNFLFVPCVRCLARGGSLKGKAAVMANSFNSDSDYVAKFTPLLFEELKSEVLCAVGSSKDETQQTSERPLGGSRVVKDRKGRNHWVLAKCEPYRFVFAKVYPLKGSHYVVDAISQQLPTNRHLLRRAVRQVEAKR